LETQTISPTAYTRSNYLPNLEEDAWVNEGSETLSYCWGYPHGTLPGSYLEAIKLPVALYREGTKVVSGNIHLTETSNVSYAERPEEVSLHCDTSLTVNWL
jgi:hypothetical protein